MGQTKTQEDKGASKEETCMLNNNKKWGRFKKRKL